VTGFWLVSAGTVTVDETAAAAVLFHRLFNPVGLIMFTFDDVQAAGASLARLVRVRSLAAEAETRRPRGPRTAAWSCVACRSATTAVRRCSTA
jgi:ABC-type bacteriocin/lantibiotic exporter with double-glycine peptidase domain